MQQEYFFKKKQVHFDEVSCKRNLYVKLTQNN